MGIRRSRREPVYADPPCFIPVSAANPSLFMRPVTCDCLKIKCVRHGYCEPCVTNHARRKHLPYCQRPFSAVWFVCSLRRSLKRSQYFASPPWDSSSLRSSRMTSVGEMALDASYGPLINSSSSKHLLFKSN
jgi:hypothetical protein